ncbi:MFS transporter [Ralstonia pseudosolanacearum]|uniref:MFS transporter n=1 Tax=Ralstonia pseudosolanacearum TaxID=1310165 RepID=UPI0007D7A26B|nr:MFS transporter [Ralstonia pseudosolanacearum]MDC6296146.1 MFS transporter [Ralstonia pseudosolanacearum]MDD7791698.1 MFS transporter [Ralstonia pseudosolanacearum]MDN3368744.1 MFS transporter [Ralstonia pseudosolanacearum]OAK91229.1 MFS transporter [Ralstonia pseudosolanacearum]QOK87622.1 MFS transporter [Ralstonia pseudosolanacearum]
MFNSRLNPDVLRLASSQALAGANSTVIFATGAIIGHMLAPSPALATVPVSIFVVGMAAATLPVGVVTRRYGRKTSALFGSVCGVTVGLLAALALVIQSFSLFCVAMLFGGAYAAVVLTYRFAAAECVPAEHRARAMSTVLAGGVAAGVLGPQLVTATMNLWSPHAYAVTYLASAGTAVLSAIVLQGVRFEHQPPVSAHAHGRPSSDIMRQPRFVVAMLCGVVSYMMMNFMMTSAPLAMELCGIPRVHANYGIEIHVIAMYAPSFFTGRLIARFGAPRVSLAGLALIALAAATGMTGVSVNHFWVALLLLGLGWNFGFLGASAMVLTCHTPAEGPRVQSIYDFVVFGAMVVGSFASGGLLATYGWPLVCGLILPPVLAAAVSLFWLRRAHAPTGPLAQRG